MARKCTRTFYEDRFATLTESPTGKHSNFARDTVGSTISANPQCFPSINSNFSMHSTVCLFTAALVCAHSFVGCCALRHCHAEHACVGQDLNAPGNRSAPAAEHCLHTPHSHLTALQQHGDDYQKYNDLFYEMQADFCPSESHCHWHVVECLFVFLPRVAGERCDLSALNTWMYWRADEFCQLDSFLRGIDRIKRASLFPFSQFLIDQFLLI